MFKYFNRKTPLMPMYYRIEKDIAVGKILTPKGDKFAKSTIYNYKSGAYRFALWERENGIIYVEDINPQWADQFIVFLMKKGYCKNTIHVTIARLKSVLRRLGEMGYKVNLHGLRATGEEVTTVYSSIEDIRTMLDLDMSETPGFERVRDVYVLQCFLGLRFGDLKTVLRNPKNYIREAGGKWFFHVKTHKTAEIVVIPIAQVVKQILDKYAWDFGNVFTYQYYNLSIKSVARAAGLMQDIVFSRTEGGQRVDTLRQKCELMSSHTARRTFATNAFLSGLPEKNIMMITGHRTTQSFQRYIRCTALDAAIKIANHDFFNIDLPVTVFLPHTDLPALEG